VFRSQRIRLQLPASFEDLHAVLSDYGRYRDWLPHVTQSRVLVHEGDISVVELEAPRFAVRPVTFEFICTTPDRIIFRQVGQLGVRGLSGAFTITTGTGGARMTGLEVEARLRLPLYRLAPRRLLRRMLEESCPALEARLNALARPPSAADRRRMILEVRRRRGTLEVWYQGAIFSCPLDDGDSAP
jgi:hypothetical protein